MYRYSRKKEEALQRYKSKVIIEWNTESKVWTSSKAFGDLFAVKLGVKVARTLRRHRVTRSRLVKMGGQKRFKSGSTNQKRKNTKRKESSKKIGAE